MGSKYLDGSGAPNLADVCRKAAARTGVKVVEVGGRSTPGPQWKTRSRGSGGYNEGYPNHIIIHHTAGNSEGWDLSNYLCFDHDDKPCANLALMSNGDIYVQAGGASNHAGKGWDPCDPPVTPDDTANSQSIGIEASNRGDGSESWSTIQQDSYVALCGELCLAYGIPAARIHEHAEWTYKDGRKIDPAGPSRYATGNDTWDGDDFRRDVQDYIDGGGGSTPPPDPEPGPTPGGDTVEVDMAQLPVIKKGDSGEAVKRMQHLLAAAGYMNEANVNNYDGSWGDGTDDAKYRFDEAHGLGDPRDTSCGAKSWESLLTGRVW